MVFPVVGGDGKPTGYEIDNSLRFNDGDSAQLSREFSADPDTRKKFTISFWAKRGELGSDNAVFGARTTANFWSRLHFDSSDRIRLQNVASGSTDVEFEASVKLRDPSAWYHIVFAVDTTQSAIGDGVKLYINGTRITDTSSTNYSQNATFEFARNGTTNYIGRDDENSSFFDGYISEFYYVDNQQLAPTAFGETNDNGVWIPIDAKDDITFGANGFYLEFKQTGTSQNSSGIGADTSGNDEHFAVANLAATDVTTDTPTNNFAILIPALNMELSEGNTKAVTTRTGNWDGVHSSIGVTSGKWYFEVKASRTEDNFRVIGGVAGNPENFTILINGQGASGDPLSTFSNTYPFYGKGVWLDHWYDEDYNDSSTASTQSSGDILQFALDMDNYKLWIGVNGQFKDNSNNNVSYSDVASGNSATVTIASGAYTGKTFFPAIALRDDQDADDNVAEINFGNPSFSISSGNTDGLYGNFEYAVPSGYYALCTKRLATYG